MWRATVLTIFPEMFPGPLGASLAGKASGRLWSLEAVDIRDFTTDKHRSVDDTPAGGGPGMVMRADVIARAIDAVAADARPRLLMSPRGRLLTQARVRELAAGPGVAILCGRFEGIDERVIAGRGLEEVSIGDYVLSGGEIAAMAVIDACVRLIPGRDGKGNFRCRGELQRRPPRVPPVHAAAALGGPRHPGGASVRGPRQGPGMAARRRPSSSPASAGPTSGRLTRPACQAKSQKQVPKGRSDSRNKGSTEG